MEAFGPPQHEPQRGEAPAPGPQDARVGEVEADDSNVTVGSTLAWGGCLFMGIIFGVPVLVVLLLLLSAALEVIRSSLG